MLAAESYRSSRNRECRKELTPVHRVRHIFTNFSKMLLRSGYQTIHQSIVQVAAELNKCSARKINESLIELLDFIADRKIVMADLARAGAEVHDRQTQGGVVTCVFYGYHCSATKRRHIRETCSPKALARTG